jgi:tetratricopeptide (TPR) repeat protein
MQEKLYPLSRYPQGHPKVAHSLNNLAILYWVQAEYDKAEPLCRRALEMYTASAVALAESVDEASALNYASSQPLCRDAYLGVTQKLPMMGAYPSLWLNKAALTRVVEQRHLAALTAESPEARKLWEAEISLRREREQLLLTPIQPTPLMARDAELDTIEERLRVLRGKLVPLLPELKKAQELATREPRDLQQVLAAEVAFLDLQRYKRYERDLRLKRKSWTPHYVAFVVTRDKVTRVELGEAKPLETTLDLWRQSLIEGADAEPKYAAAL